MSFTDHKTRTRRLRVFGLSAITAVVTLVVFLAYPKVNQVDSELALRPEDPLNCLFPESGSWLADAFNQGLFIDMIMMTPSDDSVSQYSCPDGVTARWHLGPPPAVYFPGECAMSFDALNPRIPALPKDRRNPRDGEWWIKYFTDQARTAESVYYCMGSCNGVHEARHAKDFQMYPGIRFCKTEQNAFSDSLECLKECARQRCFGYPESPNSPIDHPEIRECVDLYNNIDHQQVAIDFNTCLCESKEDSSGPDDEICNGCVERCKQHPLGNELSCALLSVAYCKPTNPTQPAGCNPGTPDAESDTRPLDPSLKQ